MIERAALREFQLLETLQHPGILRTHGFTEHELGSALIFEHSPRCMRLDHFLAQRGERLEPETRLDMLRQITDVIRFAHDKRVVHRGLSPQSILVVDLDSDRPKIKVLNWQVGYRAGATTAGASGGQVTATSHVQRLVEDVSTAYMTPESLLEDEGTGEHLDIFSLGAIAYHLFSNEPMVTGLRNDIASLVQRDGGVMSVDELAAAVLLTRGSVEDEPLRSRQAIAVTRAAIETERIMTKPRLVVRRDRDQVIAATSQELADHAVRLGREADELALQDPLVPPGRTMQRLRAVRIPGGAGSLSDTRLLRLAAATSKNAAVSSRQELYPRGMDALRALKLSQGALLGATRLSINVLRSRVTGRYPEAAHLPDRPELDDLLKRAGFEFRWDQTVKPRGAYRLPTRDPLVSSQPSSLIRRRSTELGAPTAEITPDIAEARQFEERLQRAIADGIPGLWMLIATDGQSQLPVMDGKSISVIGPAEWARIPESWLVNLHRSNGAVSHAKAQSRKEEDESGNLSAVAPLREIPVPPKYKSSDGRLSVIDRCC